MTIQSTRSTAADIAQGAYSNTIGRLGTLFSATLQRIYAAHTERAQMRFAPQPIYSGRVVKRRRYS